MKNVFLVSDTHFGHEGVCKFLDSRTNKKIRPWNDTQSMDKDMIEYWNDIVKPTDKVYHLGDVVINRKSLATLEQLHGDKILIKGNHDIFKLNDYTKYFRDIRGYHVMDKYILSHIPVHKDCIERFKGNFHGHLHTNRIRLKDDSIDPFYFNVSVEQIAFRPILFERAKELMEAQHVSSSLGWSDPCGR